LELRPVPELTVFDLVLLPNTELYADRERFRLETDGRRLVVANYSFSREDLRRASHLNHVYNSIMSYRPTGRMFHAFLGHRIGRPTDFLEHFVDVLAARGGIPNERVFDANDLHGTPYRPVTPELLKQEIAAHIRKLKTTTHG
jgi:hypothetical protein